MSHSETQRDYRIKSFHCQILNDMSAVFVTYTSSERFLLTWQQHDIVDSPSVLTVLAPTTHVTALFCSLCCWAHVSNLHFSTFCTHNTTCSHNG
eukprot:m.81911 g.81911  ORF g.81911 m.81911 type:complete len:94 (+) comp12658_c1_seq1:125-406(+)